MRKHWRRVRAIGSALVGLAVLGLGAPFALGQDNPNSPETQAGISFVSKPAGAVVLLDGELLCRTTPCTKSVAPGKHKVTVLLELYEPQHKDIDIKANDSLTFPLIPEASTISVTSEPEGLPVVLDGKVVGITPLKGWSVYPGRHEVRVRDDCYYETGERFTVAKGEKHAVKLAPRARSSVLEVRAQRVDQEELEVPVLIDGEEVGVTPGVFTVPACSKELKVSDGEEREFVAVLSLEERRKTRFRVQFEKDKVQILGRTSGVPDGFVRIAAGTTVIGSPNGEKGRYNNERQCTSRLTYAYLFQKTELTQQDWQRVMGTNPAHFSCEVPNGQCPVERVNWFEAAAYANERSRQEGLPVCYDMRGCQGKLGGGCTKGSVQCDGDYRCKDVRFLGVTCRGWRLPTESEWEHALRAGDQSARYGKVAEIGWYSNNSGNRSHPVAQKKPSSLGLYDTLGNVSEWVQDWYTESRNAQLKDYWGPAKGKERSARGGFYGGDQNRLRFAYRYGVNPEFRGSGLGFRLVRSLP